MNSEIYISTDVETNGPIPGPYSMLSFASAAYLADKTLVDTFTANLETLPEAGEDPTTMQWWQQNPDAWQAARESQQDPSVAIQAYTDWLAALPGTPVFVSYPASFDFMFVYWYLIRFAGHSPFEHVALDIRSFAMALLKRDFHASGKANMPPHWFDNLPHSHVALDDAIAQGALFCNLLAESRAIR